MLETRHRVHARQVLLAAMDPALKEYLDKLHQDAKNDSATVLKQLQTQTSQIDDLLRWKSDLEARFAKLETTVASLQAATPPASSGAAPLIPSPPPLLAACGGLHGPSGHGEVDLTGGPPPVTTESPGVLPVTGTPSLPLVPSPVSPLSSSVLATMGQLPPPVNFPLFTGENPQLWKTLCEQYFQMFSIHDSYHVPMATLNFSGPAGIWLQSVQKKLVGLDWESFASLLCTRFGRDKHQMLIRQFYAVKQITTVADFIERFESLMNHLISYSESTHPYFFLTRFVEGLRPDIRAVVLVQRPPDLDTACSLALLQEEVADGELPSGRFSHANRSQGQAPRTASPSFFSRPATPTAGSEDRRGTDAARATAEASKVAALRAFRRAKGLCFKCGERWGKDHVCPPTVQMHIVDELLAMFSLDDAATESPPDSPISDEENLCTISGQAEDGSSAPGVLQLQAWLQGHEVLLLVDSGSSTSFVDSSFATKLSGITPLPQPCRGMWQMVPPSPALTTSLTVLGLRKSMSSRLISKYSSWVRMTPYWEWTGYASTAL